MRKTLILLLGIGLGLASTSQTAFAIDGACCSGDGSCTDTNQGGCDLGTGEFLGEGTTCATTVCLGACCLDEKTCDEESSDGCDGSGGTFQGPNTTCDLHCAAKLPTVFTYQGQLKQTGVPLSGTADVEFSLWTSAKGGDQVGDTLLKENISIANGLFSVPLDFGASVFNGNARWLEIAVRSPHDETDTELFTTLEPRQLITATPYALQTRGIFVDDSKNIGLGTANPEAKLDVRGIIRVQGAPFSNDSANIMMRKVGDSGPDNVEFALSHRSAGDELWLFGWDGSSFLNLQGWDFTNKAVQFPPGGLTMHVDLDTRRVGIGTTTPNYPLHVSGGDRAIFGLATASTGVAFGGRFEIGSTGFGHGVFGFATAVNGVGDGVLGRTNSPNGFGVSSAGDFKATGSKAFVQPHPTDPAKEIHFVSLEGNESGTYFRGSARLTDGRVAIDVPEEFKLVTEADGLTVQVTAKGPNAGLWVEVETLDRIIVRGNGDVGFNYFVNGVRRGFANHVAIRENHAYVPEVSGIPYGTQYREGHRRILVENGLLNPDFTPNERTCREKGWSLREPTTEERSRYESTPAADQGASK